MDLALICFKICESPAGVVTSYPWLTVNDEMRPSCFTGTHNNKGIKKVGKSVHKKCSMGKLSVCRLRLNKKWHG